MIDYHNHTKLCKHAEGEVFGYVEKAITLGITELAFTDHMPLPGDFDIAHRMSEKEMDIYATWVKKAQQQYSEIKILFGIEADYYEGFEEYTEKFLSQYEFDLVIMSIHFLKSWPEENWVFNYDFPNRSIEDIYSEYLQTMMEGIKTGLYDIVGHLDIIKTIGNSITEVVPDKLNQLMKEIKNQNMVVEFNSSGYRKKIGEPYPSFEMINLIKNFEIPVCVGSDAHTPNQVGLKLSEVCETLNNAGINFVTLFEKRKQKLISMDNILMKITK
jgi:histidinol-phosphatase (PHP family)